MELNGIIKKMGGAFEKAAELIGATLNSKEPILMRYHGDCDGICAALSIYLSMKEMLGGDFEEQRKRMLIFKNQTAVYELRSVVDDLELMRNMGGKPLAVLLDFSMNEESADSLKALRKAGFSVLVVDHHPVDEVGDVVLISPWLYGGNSDYSAGLLAGKIAEKLKQFDGLEELERVSLAGDKSKLIKPSEEEERKALVLDYMASDSYFAESLEMYYSNLRNPKAVDSIYQKAMRRIERVKNDALRYAKVKELGNGFKLVVVRLDKVKSGEFPPKGKICNEVLSEFGKEEVPVVVIGHDERAFHFRANGKAKEAGFNANYIIKELKGEMSEMIESGGGHDVAAGLRANEGFERMVLEEIVKKIERISN
ncbi:MAG: DHH family phosphoesterase [Candidatus Micrarchaeia archaeon]